MNTDEKVPMNSTITRSPLTVADRCDRCAAQAQVRVFLESGSELQFCGHHFREHEVRLRSVAIEVQDNTNEEPDATVQALS